MPKLINLIGLILVTFLVILLWFGVFQKVKIEDGKINEKLYGVYLIHHGSYSNVYKTINNVKEYLKQKGVVSSTTFGVYYQDPQTTPKELLTSWGGVIVKDPVKVEEPYQMFELDPRENIYARFQGNPFFAVFKVYPKLKEYYEIRGIPFEKPVLEVYSPAKYGQNIIEYYIEK